MTNCLFFSSREGERQEITDVRTDVGHIAVDRAKRNFFSADCRKKSGPFLFSSCRKEIRSHPPTLVLPWVGSWDKTIIHRFSSPSFFFFYICQIDIIDHGSWSRGKRTEDQRKEGGREDRPPPPPKPFGKSGLINLASAAQRGGREEEKKEEGKKSFFTSSENFQGSYERLGVFLVGLPTFYRYF